MFPKRRRRILVTRGGNRLPQTGLLFYSRLPNTEDILWDEEALWDENMLWGGWVLPVECYAAVGLDFWFSDAATPVAKTGAEILAWAAINQYHVMFSLAKGLAVYDPYTTSDSVINKAHRYFKATTYDDTPTAYFNGVDITGSTSFDSGTLGTNPGQWVLDNTGVLVNAGVDVPAMQGMRLDGTTWRDTTITGELILPSVNQATRTSGTVLDGTELGPELVTVAADRDFSSDTGWWTKGTGVTISGNICAFTSVATGAGLTKLGILTVGKYYKIEFDADISSGGFYASSGGVSTPVLSTVGASRFSRTIAGSGSVSIGIFASGITTGTIDNISIKEVLPAFTNVFTPSTTFKKYTRTNPATDMPGFLSEPARTNKCTCRKSNPVDTTNATKSGDAAAVLSVVDDTAALTAAGLIGLCNSGKVYKLDNSAGTTQANCSISGSTGNTNIHALSILARGVGTTYTVLTALANNEVLALTDNYTKFERICTPTSTANNFQVRVLAGSIAYFILPHLEEGAFCTSPIAKLQDGTDPLTAITRAGTVLTYPTAGKIRSNNMAFRMTVVPRASGQTDGSTSLLSLYRDGANSFDCYFTPTQLYIAKQVLGSGWELAWVNYSHISGTPVEVIAIQSNIGLQISCRQYSTTWSSWSDSALKDTNIAKANIVLPENYRLGSKTTLYQFTGNISELDTLFIPEGITDPLAWAKAQWGLPA